MSNDVIISEEALTEIEIMCAKCSQRTDGQIEAFKQLMEVLGDDQHAAMFQTVRQYRIGLMRVLDEAVSAMRKRG